MTKIKAVVMDKDGSTILRPNILPENLRDLISSRQDLHWLMATGRSLCNVLKSPMVEILAANSPHIIEGGARIVRLDGTPLYESHLTPAELEHFFRVVPLDKLHYLFYSTSEQGGFAYSQDLVYWRQQLQLLRETADIEEFKSWVSEVRPAKLSVRVKENIELPGLTWTQNDSYVDVTSAGVHKGSSMVTLLEMIGVQPHEAVFVFNDWNDLPVLEQAELAELITLKVGDLLPEISADYHVANPEEVAPLLATLLADCRS